MSWIIRLLRSLVGRQTYAYERVEDTPEEVAAGIVYLVGDGEKPWYAVLKCPCSCSQTISLSLVPGDSPRWRAILHKNGTLTLHPSIWRTKGCQSHFFIRRGRIIWARARIDVVPARRRAR